VKAENAIRATQGVLRACCEILLFRNYCLDIFWDRGQKYFIHVWKITENAGILWNQKENGRMHHKTDCMKTSN